jgi:REP element-mobilizing transposase RayT
MGYHPRIESNKVSFFSTIRCRNSRLWFVNNPKLEERILAYTAKYLEVHSVELYAFAIEGNHTQDLAEYPLLNRSNFMRDRNSTIGKLVPNYCKDHKGGGLWGRRYSTEIVPSHTDDIEDRFFYIVLQPVQDGLVQKIKDYDGYNCFHDAAWGKTRKFKVVNWTLYNIAKRSNPKVSIKDFTTIYKLKYKRIPGYEHLSQRQYALMLEKKLEERRQLVVAKRLAEGKGFAGPELVKQTKPGAIPKSTKTSERFSYRPRVLSTCRLRRKEWLDFYFDCYCKYKKASGKFRKGIFDIIFPDGMFPPWCNPKHS